MNVRLIQNGMLITLAPVVSMILAYVLGDYLVLQLCVVALGMTAQIAAVSYFRHDMKKLIHPSDRVLKAMGLPNAAAAYRPNRLKWDVRISSVLGWFSVITPLFMLAALHVPAPLHPASGALSLGGQIVLVGVGVLVVSNVAMCYWVRASQAAVIANQKSESRRYQLQGFAMEIDKPGNYARYLRVVHPEKAISTRPQYEAD